MTKQQQTTLRITCEPPTFEVERWHALSVDFSPSEQLIGQPERVISMAFAFTKNDINALDWVGTAAVPPVTPFTLGKWRGKSTKYKLSLVQHLCELVKSEVLAFGFYHAEEHAVKQIGKAQMDAIIGQRFDEIIGPFDHNSSGRERTKVIIPSKADPDRLVEFVLLMDEVYIVHWILNAVGDLLSKLNEVFGERRGLLIQIDRLPLDCRDDPIKLEFLALLFEVHFGNTVRLSTHKHGVVHNRDLLADNIAGLANEVFREPKSRLSKAMTQCEPPVFGFEKWYVSSRTLKEKGLRGH